MPRPKKKPKKRKKPVRRNRRYIGCKRKNPDGLCCRYHWFALKNEIKGLLLPEEALDPYLRLVRYYISDMSRAILGRKVMVNFIRQRKYKNKFIAQYITGKEPIITWNLDCTDQPWSTWWHKPKAEMTTKDQQDILFSIDDTLIHELAHEHGLHGEASFEDALSRNGAMLALFNLHQSDVALKFLSGLDQLVKKELLGA